MEYEIKKKIHITCPHCEKAIESEIEIELEIEDKKKNKKNDKKKSTKSNHQQQYSLGHCIRNMMGFDLLVPKRNKQKMCQVDRRWLFLVRD